jgi:hypothetical protein
MMFIHIVFLFMGNICRENADVWQMKLWVKLMRSWQEQTPPLRPSTLLPRLSSNLYVFDLFIHTFGLDVSLETLPSTLHF